MRSQKKALVVEFVKYGSYYFNEMSGILKKMGFVVYGLPIKSVGKKVNTVDLSSFVDPGIFNFDVVFLDLSLEYNSGYQNFAEFLRINYKAKVIFTSSATKDRVKEFEPYFQKRAMHQEAKEELVSLVKSMTKNK